MTWTLGPSAAACWVGVAEASPPFWACRPQVQEPTAGQGPGTQHSHHRDLLASRFPGVLAFGPLGLRGELCPSHKEVAPGCSQEPSPTSTSLLC